MRYLDRSQPMAGYLSGRDLAMREQNAGLSQMQGILAIQGALENQQMAPLRRQMLEAQIADAQRKSEFQKVLRGVLSGDSAGAMGGSTAVQRDPQGNVQQGGISTPGTPVQGASRGIEQALADPRFALAAKLNGLDVSEMFKFYNTPQKFEGGSLYRDPATGTEKYQPKYGDGVQPGPGGTAQNIPGFVRASTEQEQGKLDPKMEKFMVNGKEYTMSNSDYRVLTGPVASEQDAINQMMVAERYGIPWSASPAARPQPAPAPQPQPAPQRAPVVQPLPRASDGVPGNYSPAQARPSAGIPTPSAGIPTSRVVGNSFAAPSDADKEGEKVISKNLGEQFSELTKAEFNAPNTINKYNRLGSLLGAVNTGKFTGTIQEFKAAAKSFGWDLNAMGIRDDVAPAQAVKQISNMLALELRNPSGGAGMPGALSDADRNFLMSSVPGLENDPGAIMTMIDYRVRMAKREQQVGKLARDYRKQNGKFDEGFLDVLKDFSDKNSLFPEAKSAPAPQRAPAAKRNEADILKQYGIN